MYNFQNPSLSQKSLGYLISQGPGIPVLKCRHGFKRHRGKSRGVKSRMVKRHGMKRCVTSPMPNSRFSGGDGLDLQ